jgi:monofunctional biosynthetic peptidoglycan transglycosylase
LREKNPDARLQKQWVPYERISPHLKRAIIASEDAKFVDHEGFDWEGIQKAMEKNQKRGRTSPAGRPSASNLRKTCF